MVIRVSGVRVPPPTLDVEPNAPPPSCVFASRVNFWSAQIGGRFLVGNLGCRLGGSPRPEAREAGSSSYARRLEERRATSENDFRNRALEGAGDIARTLGRVGVSPIGPS